MTNRHMTDEEAWDRLKQVAIRWRWAYVVLVVVSVLTTYYLHTHPHAFDGTADPTRNYHTALTVAHPLYYILLALFVWGVVWRERGRPSA